MLFISPCSYWFTSRSFPLQPERFYFIFLLCRSSGHKFSQFLIVWKCLNFAFIFEGCFHWLAHFRSTVFFSFSTFKMFHCFWWEVSYNYYCCSHKCNDFFPLILRFSTYLRFSAVWLYYTWVSFLFVFILLCVCCAFKMCELKCFIVLENLGSSTLQIFFLL